MESQGTPGRIQITEPTRELLGAEFVCERRGTVSVKGKGDMETWYLLGRREAVLGRAGVQRRGGQPVTTSETAPAQPAPPDAPHGKRSLLVLI
jgi:Adenylate and Guanylate cyclase catalytic domain